jgi:hypothetical protein
VAKRLLSYQRFGNAEDPEKVYQGALRDQRQRGRQEHQIVHGPTKLFEA